MCGEILTQKNRFRVYVPLTQKNNTNKYTLNDDGTLDIIGIASTTNQDLQKDIILPSAIESMKKQLLTSNKNLHGDHHYGLFDGLLGSIHTVIDSTNDTLEVGATVLSKYAGDIKEMLDIGVNLGMSIGGAPTEYDRNKDGGWTVKNARLDEISLTGMPANADTLGSVTAVHKNNIVEGTCFAGVCNKLLKNMEANDDEDLKKESDDVEGNHASAPDDETKNEIRTVVDELWSEKEQGVVETVTNSMERKVVDIVHETINHDKEGSNMSTEEKKETKPNEEEEVEETTTTTQNKEEEETKEESSKKKEEEEKVEKSITREEAIDIVNKALDDRLEKTLDSKLDSFHERFFKNLEETRKPESHTDLSKNNIEEQKESSTEPGMKKTYSTEESAEIIMKKQLSKNPLVNAISQNLY